MPPAATPTMGAKVRLPPVGLEPSEDWLPAPSGPDWGIGEYAGVFGPPAIPALAALIPVPSSATVWRPASSSMAIVPFRSP